MNHAVRCDGIHLTVCPAVGAHRTGEVGLLMKDVIPLQHHGQFLATQETVRQLGVPYHFIGVQRLIAIAALTKHVEVGDQAGTPWEGDIRIAAVLEVPGGQVVRSL